LDGQDTCFKFYVGNFEYYESEQRKTIRTFTESLKVDISNTINHSVDNMSNKLDSKRKRVRSVINNFPKSKNIAP